MSINFTDGGLDLASIARKVVQGFDRRAQDIPKQHATRVAIQQSGQVISNSYRIINFQGTGVTVTDDPTNKRSTVFIPGGAIVGNPSSTTFLSNTTAKALSLWNGSSNNSPPANWFTTGFNDSGWGAAAIASGYGSNTNPNVGGATYIWPTAVIASLTEAALFRQLFTLPAGTVTSATLTINSDDLTLAVYINGSQIPGINTGPVGNQTVSIPFNDLVPGQANLIAVEAQNSGPNVPNDRGSTTYELVINQSVAGVGSKFIGTYDQSTDIGTSLVTNTWTSIGSSFSFTVDNAAAMIRITVRGAGDLFPSANGEFGLSLLIDGSTRVMLGGGRISGQVPLFSGMGPIELTGLTAATHTCQLQYYSSAGGTWNIQPVTSPNTQFLAIRVVQVA